MRFRYRAATADGEVVEGISEAGSQRQLLDQLRGRDLHALSVQEVDPAARARRKRSGRTAAVARWSRNMAALLGAAVPMDRALRIAEGQSGHEGLAQVLKDVRERVQGGESLSGALEHHRPWFPSMVPAMVRAGEASGAPGEVFERVAGHLEQAEELRSDVRAALVYPALMAVVSAVGVVVLMLFVVPRFTAILDDFGGTLPWATRALVTTGDLFSRFWWVLAVGLGAGAWTVARWLRDEARRRAWHRVRLTLPVWGDLEAKLATATFTRTLGLLVGRGLPLLPALRISSGTVGNLHTRRVIDEGISAIAEGRPVAEGLGGALPALATEMLAVGEEGGRLGEMSERVADGYEQEVRRSVKVAVSLMEPAMIVTFGLLVGLVALAMLQAIYSVNANLGGP